MHLKGEVWETFDSGKVTIVEDMPNGWLKVLNERGGLQVIQENHLRVKING